MTIDLGLLTDTGAFDVPKILAWANEIHEANERRHGEPCDFKECLEAAWKTAHAMKKLYDNPELLSEVEAGMPEAVKGSEG
jgi:hypothetical protein